MEKYSHGPFEVTGYVHRIENPESEMETIMNAWEQFQECGMGSAIEHREYPGVHAVYYDYTNPTDLLKKGYRMLLGYVTTTGAIQSDTSLTTLHIPAQDYAYTTLEVATPETIGAEWHKINTASQSELPRIFGYDLDMYGEDGKSVTIAVSVKK